MSATGETEFLHLSQYKQQDSFNILQDYNGDMEKIDNFAKNINENNGGNNNTTANIIYYNYLESVSSRINFTIPSNINDNDRISIKAYIQPSDINNDFLCCPVMFAFYQNLIRNIKSEKSIILYDELYIPYGTIQTYNSTSKVLRNITAYDIINTATIKLTDNRATISVSSDDITVITTRYENNNITSVDKETPQTRSSFYYEIIIYKGE